MSDESIPEWAKKRKETGDEIRLRNEVERLTEFAAGRLVDAEGPQFVRDFIDELGHNFSGAKHLGFSGAVTPKFDPNSDYICHVEVIRPGYTPHLTSTNVFYRRGGGELRFLTLERDTFSLPFIVVRERVMVMRKNSTIPMSAKEAASWIIESMCDRVGKASVAL
jgi:hypothetical protein